MAELNFSLPPFSVRQESWRALESLKASESEIWKGKVLNNLTTDPALRGERNLNLHNDAKQLRNSWIKFN